VDSQIVSELGTTLEVANNHKGRKYEEIPGFNGLIQGLVHRTCTIHHVPCTISCKGVPTKIKNSNFQKSGNDGEIFEDYLEV
jgi:hypothetical protein